MNNFDDKHDLQAKGEMKTEWRQSQERSSMYVSSRIMRATQSRRMERYLNACHTYDQILR